MRSEYYFIPELFALFVVAPLAWMAFDREPPQWRISGTISAYTDARNMPRAGEFLTVTWKTTPRTRDCDGLVQIEIVDRESNIWAKLERPALNRLPVGTTTLWPGPWLVPRLATPGPALYRVTTFWYCTWMQRFFNWPVIQVGPDVPFAILPPREN